ncbi:hypothetical protein WKH56_05395 [Priestia sp. SB1]|uniref:hypothetical protein n=1 Tax=Priestia sp. SB1 TaxID=3132359 RepID=UPI00317AA2CD
MKETTDKQTKSFIHNLIGYTVCVALVFIAFFTTVFVTLLFNDYAIRYEVIGWLYEHDIRFKTAVWLLEKVDPLLPYSREPSFEAVPEIPRQSSYSTW